MKNYNNERYTAMQKEIQATKAAKAATKQESKQKLQTFYKTKNMKFGNIPDDNGVFWRILKHILVGSWCRTLIFIIISSLVALFITDFIVSTEGTDEPLYTTIMSLISASVIDIIAICIIVKHDGFEYNLSPQELMGNIKLSAYNYCYLFIGLSFLLLTTIAITLSMLLSMNIPAFSSEGIAKAFETISVATTALFGMLTFSTFFLYYNEKCESSICPRCKRMYAYNINSRRDTGLTRTYTKEIQEYVPSTLREIATLTDKSTGKEYSITTGHEGYTETKKVKETRKIYDNFYSCRYCSHFETKRY